MIQDYTAEIKQYHQNIILEKFITTNTRGI
jgi:hypothetical protein